MQGVGAAGLGFGQQHGEGFSRTATAICQLVVILQSLFCFCQNVFYYHGDIVALFSSGTVFWMGETVAFDVFTAAVTLSIGMLSVLYPQDIDNLK